MNSKLYIPKKLNVGFQMREGTYTGKLAYIIYWDDKGKLRKENSWQSWRHKPEDRPYSGGSYVDGKWTVKPPLPPYGDVVKPLELDNTPVEGFVLNKNAGGVRSGWGWNDRIEKCRVYDPRGFEIEISIPNLLYILQECNAHKGKGIDGEFVYSWSGTELVLLPTHSQEYKECVDFTKLQSKKISVRDLKEGHDYLDKKGRKLCYIGRHLHWFDIWSENPIRRNHLFYDYEYERFIHKADISEETGTGKDFNDIMDKFYKSDDHADLIESYELTDIKEGQKRIEEVNGILHLYDYRSYGYYHRSPSYNYIGSYKLVNGLFKPVKQEGELRPIGILKQIKINLKNKKSYKLTYKWEEVK